MTDPLQLHAPTPDSGFTPRCPHCRYDLSTLPDGRCPECGTSFTLAQLQLAQNRRQKRGALPGFRAAVWTLGWFGVALFFDSVFEGEHAHEIAFLWVWVSLAWVVRRDMRRRPFFAFIWAFIPIAACVSASGHLDLMQNYPPTYARTSIYLGLALTAPLLFCPRHKRPRRVALAGIICGLGAPLFSHGLQGLIDHQHWSAYPDIRWWPPYSSFPFTNAQAARFGAVIMCLGTLIALTPFIRTKCPIRAK